MKALKVQSPGHAAVVSDAKIPSLRPDYILIQTVAVALNPTDWKHLAMVSTPTTLGCDYAGVVLDVGSAVTKPFQKGDRVAGFVHGGNVVQEEDGAFGEYLVAKGDLQVKIPDGMSFEAAATLGVGIVTIGMGLYQSLGLPLPPAKAEFPVLIYGGSSTMGAYAIQWAKLSGLEVITTCSKHNFDYVKSLGADAVFDYRSPTCGADIRAYTSNKLFFAWDTISEGGSPQICADALSSESLSPAGKRPAYGAILAPSSPRKDIDVKYVLGYTAIGEEFVIRGRIVPAVPEDFEYVKMFSSVAEEVLRDGKVKPHRYEVRSGGLDGILGGLMDMKEGRISGKKVVYRIADTGK